MKVTAATTLEPEELQRLEALAAADQRSMASTIRLAVLKGLPALERDILGAQFAGKSVRKNVSPTPTPEKVEVGG